MSLKKALICALLAFFLLTFCAAALAFEDETLAEQAKAALFSLDKAALAEMYASLPGAAQTLFAPEGIDALLWSLVSGGAELSLSGAADLVGASFAGLLKFAAGVLSLCVLGSAASHVTGAFGRGSSEIAGFICYALAIGSVTALFTQSLTRAADAVSLCSNGVNAAFPVLLSLMTATGQAASAGLLQSATAVLTQLMASVSQGALFPLTLALGACAVVANISGSVPIKNMQKLIKSAIKWLLGLMSTFYLGTLAVRSIASRGADGLSLRAARFTLDKLVPYVGGIMSGSVDSVLGILALVKNAFGLCAALLAAGVLLLPILRLGAVQLAFRLIAAIAEPIGDARLASALSDLADALACAAAVTLVSLLMLTLTIGALLSCSSVIL